MSQSINSGKKFVYSGTATFPSKAAMDQVLLEMQSAHCGSDVRATNFHFLGNSIEFRKLDMRQLTYLTENTVAKGGEIASFSTDDDVWRYSARIEFKSLERLEEFSAETAKMGLWVVDFWLDEDARTVQVSDASLTEIEHLKDVAERHRGKVIIDESFMREETSRQKMQA